MEMQNTIKRIIAVISILIIPIGMLTTYLSNKLAVRR